MLFRNMETVPINNFIADNKLSSTKNSRLLFESDEFANVTYR